MKTFQGVTQFFSPSQTPVTPPQESVVHEVSPNEKDSHVEGHVLPRESTSDSDEDGSIHKEAQAGVQKIEGMAQVWDKKALYAAYAIIWCLYFLHALESGTTGLLTPYVVSDFSAHSLTAATSIMSSLIAGIFALPLAKIIDIWGRPQGFLIMVICMTIGQVMMAVCQNVETYAAAAVFNQVGGNGRGYVMSILVADTSSLKHRGFMFALISSPYILTVWCGGPVAQAFLNGLGWRWAFGVWAIVIPISSLPLYILMQWNQTKAIKANLVPRRDSGRNTFQSIKYYILQYDIIGLLLICGGLALFLLPFSIYSYQAQRWQSPMIICMLVFGLTLLISFGLYEAYLAPTTFFPWALLKDRTILGANILAMVLFIEFYIWDSYFSSFLQVVPNIDLTRTGYIMSIYSIGACAWSFVAGIILSKTGDFKRQCLYFGLPITILGVALMIHFRQPDVNVGFIVMCQIFIAVGGGTLVIGEQVAAMAATTHQYVAVVLAVEGMFSQIGGAIGSTVAAAIWTGQFLPNLERLLPAEAQTDVGAIYGNLTMQLSYPVGTATRDAIAEAYGLSQRTMCIAATAVLSLAVVAVVMWRDIDVRTRKQVKGVVF